MPRLSRIKVSPAQVLTPEPCDNCYNPDASATVCTVCQYPWFIPNHESRYPGIGCSRCLSLNLERLDNGHCTRCRKAWPGFVAPAAN